MKVGLLVPCTSKGRQWTNIKQTYFYNLTFKTFLMNQDKEHEYHFYLGVDNDDPIFTNAAEQDVIRRFTNIFKNIHIHFVVLNIQKGFLTKMWNELYKLAYTSGCEYFYQCGDDIHFHTAGWVNDSINTLVLSNGVGLTGPINNNNRILTQAFVSRKHMEIFGYFFPENILNWGCDDWYNHVYQPNHFFPLKNHFCSNEGGEPRYLIDGKRNFRANYAVNVGELRKRTMEQAIADRIKIEKFIKR
jgi:hypothetical protein